MPKQLKEATCKHAHCREPIYFSDFTDTWCHWSSAGEPCPSNTDAEILKHADQVSRALTRVRREVRANEHLT